MLRLKTFRRLRKGTFFLFILLVTGRLFRSFHFAVEFCEFLIELREFGLLFGACKRYELRLEAIPFPSASLRVCGCLSYTSHAAAAHASV